jgi:phosphoribosyl 1,2-cyclic phosphodiesterase
MLKSGPYPPQLKARILSDLGHLSNNLCANELKNLFSNGTRRFILGHLSQHNNTPLLAKSSAEAALMDLGAKQGCDYILNVAKPTNNGVTVL